MTDKRRYVSRNPRNPREVMTIDQDRSGNIAQDGYTVRSQAPMKLQRDVYSERAALPSGLMDENEAEWRSAMSPSYEGDY